MKPRVFFAVREFRECTVSLTYESGGEMLVNKPFVRKVVLSLALIAGLLSGDMIRAQIDTGKIEGVVRDKDTGQPLSYAQVVVDGTRLGNVTSNDGYYFILNIPPGSHTIRAISTGYQTVAVEKVEVMAGHTSTVNFNLQASVYELEAITVESEQENLIIRDNTMSKQRQTGEQISLCRSRTWMTLSECRQVSCAPEIKSA